MYYIHVVYITFVYMKPRGKRCHFDTIPPAEIYANKLPYSFGTFFFSFSLLTRTRPVGLAVSRAAPRLRASPGNVLQNDVLTTAPAQLVLAAMERRGCDGATRVNELLWRRDTTPDVDDNRPQCGDIDHASWPLIGTARRRHVATSDNAVSWRTPQS